MEGSDRRLAAVAFVDLVGYTQLSQRNEELALRLLEEYRGVLRPIFARHMGVEVKTIGDGFLVEFTSALEAVRCAFDIQQALHDLNVNRPPEGRILARLGVHVGDVVHSQGDIYGDAVNIASRIEPLAEPGGICISQPVEAQVRNKFVFPLVSIGSKTLKNVDSPIEVYKVAFPWDQPMSQGMSQAPRTRIAVLPFSNISPDPSDEYFADGMTEELINTISHNHQLKVIARTSVGRYKGSQKSISEIGKEIGAGSILEGSVRKAGNKIRVTAQLIDASTEDHMWSDNYDRQVDDVFSIQSDIAKSVSEALMVRLFPEERKTMERRATKSSAAYVACLRGRTAMRDRSENGLKEAKKLFEEAVAEDPDYAEAYAGLADVYFLLQDYEHMPRAEAFDHGRKALAKALSLDDGLAEAHNSMAEYLAKDYRFAEAETEFKRAIALNPNYALAHHWYAIELLEMGRLEESVLESRRAEELDPLSPALALNLALNTAQLGNEEESEMHLKKLKALDSVNQFLDFANALVSQEKGDVKAAAMHLEAALSKHPGNAGYMSILSGYYCKLGEMEKAMALLQKIKSLPEGTPGKPFNLGFAYAGLGEKDEALRQFETAIEDHSMLFRVLRYGHLEPGLTEDPRFVKLFERAGLNSKNSGPDAQ